MLDSASVILDQYLDGVSRYALYSIEMERSENPDDLYFLCCVSGRWYVVLETDYVVSLPHVANEAAESFGVRPLHWVLKKQHGDGSGMVPVTESFREKSLLDDMIFRPTDSYFCYAVLAVELAASESGEKRYNPSVYGYVRKSG